MRAPAFTFLTGLWLFDAALAIPLENWNIFFLCVVIALYESGLFLGGKETP